MQPMKTTIAMSIVRLPPHGAGIKLSLHHSVCMRQTHVTILVKSRGEMAFAVFLNVSIGQHLRCRV